MGVAGVGSQPGVAQLGSRWVGMPPLRPPPPGTPTRLFAHHPLRRPVVGAAACMRTPPARRPPGALPPGAPQPATRTAHMAPRLRAYLRISRRPRGRFRSLRCITRRKRAGASGLRPFAPTWGGPRGSGRGANGAATAVGRRASAARKRRRDVRTPSQSLASRIH